MSAEAIEQELENNNAVEQEIEDTKWADWDIPTVYPYSENANPNPRNERVWVRELSEQVEFLTTNLVSALARIDELELTTKRPPPKPTTQPKPKGKTGGD